MKRYEERIKNMRRAYRRQFGIRPIDINDDSPEDVTEKEIKYLQKVFSKDFCDQILKIEGYTHREKGFRYKYLVFDQKNELIMKYEKKQNFHQKYITFPFIKPPVEPFLPHEEEYLFNDSEEDRINILVEKHIGENVEAFHKNETLV